ncbi:MAG: hypothetical protein ACOCWR_01905 [Oceanidesulfovibrio sp.]
MASRIIIMLTLLTYLTASPAVPQVGNATEPYQEDTVKLTIDQNLREVEQDIEAYLADIDERFVWLESRLDSMISEMDKYNKEVQQEFFEGLAVIARERQELRRELFTLDSANPNPAVIKSINEQLEKLQEAYEKTRQTAEKGRKG